MKYTLNALRRMADAELTALEKQGLVVAVCENNDLPTLRYLVEERHLPIDREYDETLPLMAAAANGTTEMIDYLLSHGADIDCLTDDEWHTPLIRAALADRPHMVLHLSEKGANPCIGECCEESVHCMLHYPDVIRRLLETGADPDILNIDWETPLDVCAAHSPQWGEWIPENEQEILEHSIRIDSTLAETMEILIEFGASPYLTQGYRHRRTLPDTPNGQRLWQLIEEAVSRERSSVPLYINLYKGCYSTKHFLQVLLHFEKKGVDLTDPPPWKDGANLLWYAVKFGNIEALNYLLRKGCLWEHNVDYVKAALFSENPDMVKRMLRMGFCPKHPGKIWNGLYASFRSSLDKSVAWLPIEQGWVPEPLHNGYTVLHALAYRKDYVESLKLFAAYVECMGLDPEAATHAGKTPRDIAEEQNFTALLTYLDTRRNQASI